MVSDKVSTTLEVHTNGPDPALAVVAVQALEGLGMFQSGEGVKLKLALEGQSPEPPRQETHMELAAQIGEKLRNATVTSAPNEAPSKVAHVAEIQTPTTEKTR